MSKQLKPTIVRSKYSPKQTQEVIDFRVEDEIEDDEEQNSTFFQEEIEDESLLAMISTQCRP